MLRSSLPSFGKALKLLPFAFLILCAPGLACQRSSPISVPEMIKGADFIVHATAVDYAVPPTDPRVYTTGEPDSRVRFKTQEVVKRAEGHAIRLDETFILPGYLSEKDDFNDHEPPYRFVRPNGRWGSCFANTYRRGADFLLFLKSTATGVSVDWYALGPVNEQLRGRDDPWLRWVRDHLQGEHESLARVTRQPYSPTRYAICSSTRKSSLLTIEEPLGGKGIDYPAGQQTDRTFKRAPKQASQSQQPSLVLPEM